MSIQAIVVLGLIIVVLLVIIVAIWSVTHKPKRIMAAKQDKKWSDLISRWDISRWMLAIAVLFALSMMFAVVVQLNQIGQELSSIDSSLSGGGTMGFRFGGRGSIQDELSNIDSTLDSIDRQLGMMR